MAKGGRLGKIGNYLGGSIFDFASNGVKKFHTLQCVSDVIRLMNQREDLYVQLRAVK